MASLSLLKGCVITWQRLQAGLALCGLGLALPLQAVPMKIACIGDSITYGAGLSNPATESYPGRLQRLFGTNYVVRNFGVSGRTLLKQGDFPYWKDSNFQTSHDWQPDLVIIQLGTNDAKPYNWRYGTNFVSDYEAMIDSYAILTNAPQVVVCTPCPVYAKGAFDIVPGTVATNIAPAVRDIATRRGLVLVDLHTRLAAHPELFPDTVHPNSKGATVMAAVMYSTLAGETPADPPPALGLELVSATRFALEWPASWRGLVPQSTTGLNNTNVVWSVAEPIIYLDGNAVRQTNTLTKSTSVRLYRLWKP
jgi:lysophospholipase L1-like esterase